MKDFSNISRDANPRPPIAILGVPFDNVTRAEAVARVEAMIASRQPHYLVTPNIDFLVQARRDVELRRILCEAHLVLCDGTPLVWISKLLGNGLPERVAGADLVPALIEVAAHKRYRLFLLGATSESSEQAVKRLRQRHPDIVIAGHYSPPFNQLLEMNHDEIRGRILAAEPDLLFVSFGCPKQEKWVAMNYRQLGVPVTAGVGATIDFLAGTVTRAPIWMQKSGTEWIFRLAQEPRRLFRRYLTDLWAFSASIVPQWWELQARSRFKRGKPATATALSTRTIRPRLGYQRVRMPVRLDFAAVLETDALAAEIERQAEDCLLDLSLTKFIDSTGVGWLLRVKKRLRAKGKELVLVSPTRGVKRALALMRLTDFFFIASDENAACELLCELRQVASEPGPAGKSASRLCWSGEVTAANADTVWTDTRKYLVGPNPDRTKTIDLSRVRFIDSTGVGLMVRARKLSLARAQTLIFIGLQPAVLNVLRLSRLEAYLLKPPVPKPPELLTPPTQDTCESAFPP
jgi:N-acetylglucosaminyldiphosphoundecaprenol N-acetyl-beta-D-mannosaminyltransferase